MPKLHGTTELIQDGPLQFLTQKAAKVFIALNLAMHEAEEIWDDPTETMQFGHMSLVFQVHTDTQLLGHTPKNIVHQIQIIGTTIPWAKCIKSKQS